MKAEDLWSHKIPVGWHIRMTEIESGGWKAVANWHSHGPKEPIPLEFHVKSGVDSEAVKNSLVDIIMSRHTFAGPIFFDGKEIGKAA